MRMEMKTGKARIAQKGTLFDELCLKCQFHVFVPLRGSLSAQTQLKTCLLLPDVSATLNEYL